MVECIQKQPLLCDSLKSLHYPTISISTEINDIVLVCQASPGVPMEKYPKETCLYWLYWLFIFTTVESNRLSNLDMFIQVKHREEAQSSKQIESLHSYQYKLNPILIPPKVFLRPIYLTVDAL